MSCEESPRFAGTIILSNSNGKQKEKLTGTCWLTAEPLELHIDTRSSTRTLKFTKVRKPLGTSDGFMLRNLSGVDVRFCGQDEDFRRYCLSVFNANKGVTGNERPNVSGTLDLDGGFNVTRRVEAFMAFRKGANTEPPVQSQRFPGEVDTVTSNETHHQPVPLLPPDEPTSERCTAANSSPAVNATPTAAKRKLPAHDSEWANEAEKREASWQHRSRTPKTPYGPTESTSNKRRYEGPVNDEEHSAHSPSNHRRNDKSSEQLGIVNAGMTCYLATAVWFLFFTPFRKRLLQQTASLPRPEPPEGDTLPLALSALFTFLSRKSGPAHITRVKRALAELNPRFQGCHQEDCQECLQAILEGCPDAAKGFKWSTERQLRCMSPECHKVTSKQESMTFLPLDLPRVYDDTAEIEPIKLHTLLERYFRREKISYKCGSCGHNFAESQYRITMLPEVFIIQLKRFSVSGTGKIQKRDEEVEIGETLDVAQWMTDDPMKAMAVEKRNTATYDQALSGDQDAPLRLPLQERNTPVECSPITPAPSTSTSKLPNSTYHVKSLVTHLGSQLYRGHYILDSFSRKDRKWFCYDDVDVRQLDGDASSLRRRGVYLASFVRSDIMDSIR
ncbi:hypothetical protein BC832DRAFT_14054 [Gaertneriomyces semiglobifer]|nr:hypothetical protein BC832DRAFT_14054 [Gaertneriomyces semiglobifer]